MWIRTNNNSLLSTLNTRISWVFLLHKKKEIQTFINWLRPKLFPNFKHFTANVLRIPLLVLQWEYYSEVKPQVNQVPGNRDRYDSHLLPVTDAFITPSAQSVRGRPLQKQCARSSEVSSCTVPVQHECARSSEVLSREVTASHTVSGVARCLLRRGPLHQENWPVCGTSCLRNTLHPKWGNSSRFVGGVPDPLPWRSAIPGWV